MQQPELEEGLLPPPRPSPADTVAAGQSGSRGVGRPSSCRFSPGRWFCSTPAASCSPARPGGDGDGGGKPQSTVPPPSSDSAWNPELRGERHEPCQWRAPGPCPSVTHLRGGRSPPGASSAAAALGPVGVPAAADSPALWRGGPGFQGLRLGPGRVPRQDVAWPCGGEARAPSGSHAASAPRRDSCDRREEPERPGAHGGGGPRV